MKNASPTGNHEFAAIAGNLYARWTLDCLADIAYAISYDAVSRPQLYQDDGIPDDLVTLRMSYGTAADLPNFAQRQAMMTPILGPSDGRATGATTVVGSQSSFQIARRKFVDACAAFAQHASDLEAAILAERVRSAAATLRAHLDAVRGKSFALSARQVHAISDTAIHILGCPSISKVFGIGHLQPEWPLGSADPAGAKLVEGIGTTLLLSGDCRLTFTDFLLLQRIAHEGSAAIHTLLAADPLSDGGLQSLVSSGYTWGASLREAAGGRQYVPQSATGQAPVMRGF